MMIAAFFVVLAAVALSLGWIWIGSIATVIGGLALAMSVVERRR